MAVERIIEKILSKHSKVSKSEIMERLEIEKKKTGGLISEESLLRMIAAGLGVEVAGNEAVTLTLSTGDLIPGLNDVAIVGRVVAVFPTKTFEGNRSGKLASLLVADKSGVLRVVFWNDKTSLLEAGGIKVGEVVRVSHGYTREGRGVGVELHVGDKGEVKISPEDVREEDYPTISKFAVKIGDITKACVNRKVNFVGVVKEVFPSSVFKRQDWTSGRVMRFVLADETGEVPVVVWNDMAEGLENRLKKGVGLQVVNAKIKKTAGEGLEVHVDSGTYVEVFASGEKYWKIAALREGLDHVDLEGEVASRPVFRDIKTSKGEAVGLAVFELKDDTGQVWVSAWRKHVESIKDLKVGVKIVVRDAYVKRGFGDQPEISTRDSTRIIRVSKNEE